MGHARAHTNLCDGLGILRPVVVDEDADAAGDEDHDQRYDDLHVGHGVPQLREALTVDVEQQRHHAQSQHRGAAGHHDAEGETRGWRMITTAAGARVYSPSRHIHAFILNQGAPRRHQDWSRDPLTFCLGPQLGVNLVSAEEFLLRYTVTPGF